MDHHDLLVAVAVAAVIAVGLVALAVAVARGGHQIGTAVAIAAPRPIPPEETMPDTDTETAASVTAPTAEQYADMRHQIVIRVLATTATRSRADQAAERARQDVRWGEQNHPDGTGQWVHEQTAATMVREACQIAAATGELTWRLILLEEMYEAFAESDPNALRTELIQVAAVAVAWAEAIDRRAVTS